MGSLQHKATPRRRLISASCTVAAKAGRWTFLRRDGSLGLRQGKANVKGAEEDELCVICQAKPVDPVQVSG